MMHVHMMRAQRQSARVVSRRRNGSHEPGSGSGCPRLPPDSNLLPDIYLVDRVLSCVTRVSGSSGADWWMPSVVPAIDAAGKFVVFSSRQPMGDEDLSTDFDLFLAPRPSADATFFAQPVRASSVIRLMQTAQTPKG
jgi:hypothetical protein